MKIEAISVVQLSDEESCVRLGLRFKSFDAAARWAIQFREELNGAAEPETVAQTSSQRVAQTAPAPAAKGDWVSPPVQLPKEPVEAHRLPDHPERPKANEEPAATPPAAGGDEIPADILDAKKPRDVLVLLRDKYGLTTPAEMIQWCTENQKAIPCLNGETDLTGRLKRAMAVAGIR